MPTPILNNTSAIEKHLWPAVLSLGRIEYLHPGFHDVKNFWPVGYKVARLAATPASAKKECLHTCEILEGPDGSGPLFRSELLLLLLLLLSRTLHLTNRQLAFTPTVHTGRWGVLKDQASAAAAALTILRCCHNLAKAKASGALTVCLTCSLPIAVLKHLT